MSHSNQLITAIPASNVSNIGSEAHQIFRDLRSLRRTICEAWQERAVTLTREEQRELRDEIKDTCALLTDLTSSE